MKKILSVLLAIAFVFSMPSYLSAECYSHNDLNLYVYSEQCSRAVNDYAKDNYMRFVSSAVESGDIVVGNEVYLGSPFTIYNNPSPERVYFFPISSNNKIIGTLRVYKDFAVNSLSELANNYTAVFSTFLAEELNQLLYSGELESPMLIYNDNGNIMAYIGGNRFVLVPNTFDVLDANPHNIELPNCGTNKMWTVSNAFSYLSYDDSLSFSRSSGYVTINVVELQGNDNWCAAYSTATIIRALQGNTSTPTAYMLMSMFYSAPQSSDYFHDAYVLSAANYYGYYPTFIANTLTINSVSSQINAGKPIYLTCSDYSGNNYIGHHAIVLRGYSTDNNTYSVWNPWYPNNEYMNMLTHSYVAGNGRTLTWIETIYNW